MSSTNSIWGTWNFNTYPYGTKFANIPGVFIFSRIWNGGYQAYYIGESENVGQRILELYSDSNIASNSGQIHVLTVRDGKHTRDQIVNQLAYIYQPIYGSDVGLAGNSDYTNVMNGRTENNWNVSQ